MWMRFRISVCSLCYMISIKRQAKVSWRWCRAYLEGLRIPPLVAKWFYATDVPISKPEWFDYKQDKQPEKFIPFSAYDSNRLEARFQRLHKSASAELPLVEVNEDKLFEVDLHKYTLSPVYWAGPIYEVRRGTWFTLDGVPLPNALAQAVEVGYQLKKPYLFSKELKQALIDRTNHDAIEEAGNAVSKFSKDAIAVFNSAPSHKEHPQADMIFHIEDEKDIINLQNGKFAMYSDATHACIFPDTMNSTFEIGVMRNFAASLVALISVERVQRGFSENLTKTVFDSLPLNPIPGIADTLKNEVLQLFNATKQAPPVAQKGDDGIKSDKMQNVLEQDYDHNVTNDKSDRQVDHLVLCIHGIGQVLGNKYQSIDFTHSINVLRNTLKKVYQSDPQYRALTHHDVDDANTTIQVLPISWRHRIDFHPSKNFELFDDQGNHRLPKLSQINVDGVQSLRNIMGDVVLDVLLYYEPHYIDQVFEVVVLELNRVYSLYMERHPDFKGKVHILGHSLGSAISFDILSKQPNKRPAFKDFNDSRDLAFDVDNLFCVGSPVGVFRLLAQQNIRARELMPPDIDYRLPLLEASSPRCENLYNLFHPCDPVGYRMEPLVSPRFANFKPEPVPFAMKGLNSQIKGLATFGEGIQQKFSAAIFGKKREADAEDESALGDIIKNIVSDTSDEAYDENLVVDMRKRDLAVLTKLNKSGRIDYCLPMGVFDISLVSAISAHVSYFEDENTAGFLLKQMLSRGRDLTNHKKVGLYKVK